MNTQNTLPITSARKDIFKLAEKVQRPGIRYTLTENGRPKVVMMSANEFDSWQETMEIMSDPELMKDIKKAEKDFKNGDYVTLEDMLAEEGFVLADESRKKYVSSCNKKGRAKKFGKDRSKV